MMNWVMGNSLRAGTGWRTSGSDMLTRSLVWRRKVVKILRMRFQERLSKVTGARCASK